ncbi:MAG: bifunctional demethylmenaquinone methyltransferase/2-methoxy-6-polyprenyl-1,4-benzoquinol methylase UbiE [Deltaproteobacteria bacterium]|nr:bifunctional demethylmenaquinone methyltransferase/2-methoxy-6-polyprenyl-1,4-benzoquinol methylase UbiE [Deltaproteobacteria bacterium]
MSVAVQRMFASIASRYDTANDVLSFGIHRLWRKNAVQFAELVPGGKILDLCSGTGDFCFSLVDALGSHAEIVGVDFVEEMLELAREKASRRFGATSDGNRPKISFVQGDILKLPFCDNSFDNATIGFGIRNVDDPQAGLREIYRVLRSNGKLLVLEFGQPESGFFPSCYRIYSDFVLPYLGGLLTGNRSAYEYLPKTSQAFPCGDEFVHLMRSTDFAQIRWKRFLGGVAYAYVATKE